MSEADDQDPHDEEREAYASAVEDYFLRRRGSAKLISPRDWVLVEGWFEEGVPLEIVLAGLAEVFDRSIAQGKIEPISSISYCRHAVKKRWKSHQEAMVGTSTSSRRRQPAEPTPPLADRIREAAERHREVDPVVAAELDWLRDRVVPIEQGAFLVVSDREAKLIDIEKEFVTRLLERLDGEVRQELEREAARPLQGLETDLPSPERERLLQLGLHRAIRLRWVLPRLTLLPRAG